MSTSRDGSRTRSQTKGQKDQPTTSQFLEIKDQLVLMNQRLNEFSDLKSLVATLKNEIEAKEKKINLLQQRVENLQQYTKQDDIVIAGLKTRHKSYARATASEETTDNLNAPEDELISLEAQVTDFIEQKMNIQLTDNDVSVCHTLPGKKEVPDIVLRLNNRKIKNRLLRQARQLKGTNVYLNEHLMAKNREIASAARQLRKEQKIQNTWTRNCQIYIKMTSRNGHSSVKVIKEMKDLNDLNLM